jgi:hypothetical protein
MVPLIRSPGRNSNLLEPPHRRQQTLHQANPLFPDLFLFQFRPQQYRSRTQESMRQTHDPQAVSGEGAFEMENHRERNLGKVISGAPLYRHRLDRGLLLFHPFDLYHHLVLNPFQHFYLRRCFHYPPYFAHCFRSRHDSFPCLSLFA